MTWRVAAWAVTACTRQVLAAGSGKEPRRVLVPGSPRVSRTRRSQPRLRTPRSAQAPPPVSWRPSVSIASATTVSVGE